MSHNSVAIEWLLRGLHQASGLSTASRGVVILQPLEGIVFPPAREIAEFDMRFLFDTQTLQADMVLAGGDLQPDTTLESAVIHSLFTNARATADDLERFGGSDPRGYWGDSVARQQFQPDSWGSRLWLLSREKQTDETLSRADEFARECLAWLTLDRVAQSVAVQTAYPAQGLLAIAIEITRGQFPDRHFGFVFRQ